MATELEELQQLIEAEGATEVANVMIVDGIIVLQLRTAFETRFLKKIAALQESEYFSEAEKQPMSTEVSDALRALMGIDDTDISIMSSAINCISNGVRSDLIIDISKLPSLPLALLAPFVLAQKQLTQRSLVLFLSIGLNAKISEVLGITKMRSFFRMTKHPESSVAILCALRRQQVDV